MRPFTGARPVPLLSFVLLLVVLLQPGWARDTRQRGMEEDIRAIEASRRGLAATIDFIDSRPEIFAPDENRDTALIDRQKRLLAWQTWQRFLDHILYLDSRGQLYYGLYKAAPGGEENPLPFFLAYAAFLAQYHYALEFIERMEENPAMHVMLNEPVPELGLAEGSYASLKFRFLNLVRGAEFVRLEVLYQVYEKQGKNPLAEGMTEDRAAIWQAGRGKGPQLTFANAARIVGDLGFTAWFPVQKEVSRMLGDIKVWRPGETLISPEQIRRLGEKLEPGDILLERREWYASNVGIPGFWPHAALYIGTARQRDAYFSDPATRAWLSSQGSGDGTLDDLLARRFPEKYRLSHTPREENHPPRVIEAVGEGVVFTSLEHSGAADSLVALRPRLSQKAKARAIIRAFHYSGRPYDFNFDFRTDAELVCSELVYKAYEKTGDGEGLTMPLREVLGRPLLSPNDIVQLFDEQYGGPEQQLDLVHFLDGREWRGGAIVGDEATLRRSWQRPKWHIWLQEVDKGAGKGGSDN